MTAPDLSGVAAAITVELLEQFVSDVDELGLAELPLITWSAVLADSAGAVARTAIAAEQSHDFDELRRRALRVAVDAVSLLVQLDGDGDGGTQKIDEAPTEAPISSRPAAEPTPTDAGGTPAPPMLRAVVGDGGDDEAWWSGDRWREHLRRHGVRVADALRQAQAFAREVGQQEPAVLEAIVHADVARRLRSWIENSGSAAIA